MRADGASTKAKPIEIWHMATIGRSSAFQVRRQWGRKALFETNELMVAIAYADLMKETPVDKITLKGSTIPEGVFQFLLKIVESQE